MTAKGQSCVPDIPVRVQPVSIPLGRVESSAKQRRKDHTSLMQYDVPKISIRTLIKIDLHNVE